MNISAHTLRGPPVSESMGLPARLLHTLFVLCATILMLVIAVISFLFVLLFKSITPAPRPIARRSSGRHVTFLEPSTVITLPPGGAAVAQRSPAKGTVPSLSLTATPHGLEPPTPDVAEDPLRTLTRICGFLASNTARAWRGEELASTPPLAGLVPYLDTVKEDLERISEMVAREEGKEIVGGAGSGSEEVVVAAAGESAGTGAGADAHDEPGLVRPDRAATYARPSTPTPPSPPTPPVPNTSTSTSLPPPTPTPTPPTSEPTVQHATATPADTTEATTETMTATTTTAPGPRKRKDAVLRTKRPSIDPSNADALADADDAAVRAAALLSRVADLGAGLFDGAVRERGTALWTALSGSRRGAPTDVPVPPLPRTRFTGPAGERS